MKRNIGSEALATLAELRISGSQNSFSTVEIAQRLNLAAWRVRKSLKKMSEVDVPLIWSEGNDRWCVDLRIVRLYKVINDIKLDYYKRNK